MLQLLASLLLILHWVPVFAFDRQCLDNFKALPIQSLNFYIENLIELDQLPLLPSSEDHDDATQILKILAPMIAKDSDLNVEDVARTIAFIRKARVKVDSFLIQHCGVYVHSDQIYLKLPVLFTRSGNTYLLLERFDRKGARGGYKTFSRAIDLSTGQIVAHLASRPKEKAETTTIREIAILSALGGSSVAPALFDWEIYPETVNGTLTPTYAFQSELFYEDLTAARKRIDSDLMYAKLLLKAVESVSILHQKGYIHGDIKPQNLLVNEDLSKLVLVDFGLANEFGSHNFGTSLAGTKGFLAPELCVNRFEFNYAFVTELEARKADMFALGMTFLELAKGSSHPYYEAVRSFNQMILGKKSGLRPSQEEFYSSLDHLRNIYQSEYHNTPSESFTSLILGLANPESPLRPHPARALSQIHTWMENPHAEHTEKQPLAEIPSEVMFQ